MNGKVLLLIIGLITISGVVASANSNFINILTIASLGASDDLVVQCTAPTASVTGTGNQQTITIKIPFTTSGSINGASLGTININFTTNPSQTNPPIITSTSATVTGGATLSGSGSNFISGSVANFTLTNSGITVTSGATTGTITITEDLTLDTSSSTITVGTPFITGTDPALTIINCPTVPATLH